MQFFQVSYDRFKEEINNEKLKAEDRSCLEREDLGEGFAYYLTSLDRKIGYVFVVKKDEITPAQRMNLDPLSRPSVRVRENSQLALIAERLRRIEEKLHNLPNERVIERIETIQE